MSDIKSVGLVGFGEFGRLVASLIPKDIEVLVKLRSAKTLPNRVKQASIDKVARCDVVVLCVPLASYEQVLGELATHLLTTSLLLDVCSVKVIPAQLIAKILPEHRDVLLTHPLFGPQTIEDGIEGKRIVVTAATGKRAELIISFCRKLGFDIVTMTNEEHDREMARVHALTFFIARALSDMGVSPGVFSPPSYQSLLSLVKLDKAHSQALFETMELGNPFAAETRDKFLRQLNEVNMSLK